MNTVNSVVLVGRIGSAPEFKVYDGDKGLARFSVATDRPGKKDVTDWFRVTCFRHDAVFARDFLGKGDLVCIQGRVEVDKREEGGFWVNVVADRVTSLVSQAAKVATAPTGPGDPDLPF